jgi:hypothetical protein
MAASIRVGARVHQRSHGALHACALLFNWSNDLMLDHVNWTIVTIFVVAIVLERVMRQLTDSVLEVLREIRDALTRTPP